MPSRERSERRGGGRARSARNGSLGEHSSFYWLPCYFFLKYIGPIFRFRFASRPFLSLLCVFVLCERKGKKRKEKKGVGFWVFEEVRGFHPPFINVRDALS